jgi:hypothetical protein
MSSSARRAETIRGPARPGGLGLAFGLLESAAESRMRAICMSGSEELGFDFDGCDLLNKNEFTPARVS